MLGELWRFIKANFKKRLLIYTLVVMSLTFFGSIPILFVKLLFLPLFIIAAGLFLVIFGQLFLFPGVQQILAYKKGQSIPIPNEIVYLSNQMGVKIKKIRIVEGVYNAYVIGGAVVLGRKLLEKLNLDELLAVIAHELAHKKGRHILLRFLTMILFLVFAMYSWSRLYSPIFFTESFTQIVLTVMINIGLLAFMLVTMIVPNWILEFKADRTAAKFAGKENIKSALLKLVDKENYEEPSETHPSVAERIKHIDKL